MKIIDYEILSGQDNMQKDSDLLDYSIKHRLNEIIFRFYGWSPACVSLGRNQKSDFLNKNLLSDLGIDCVRRLTGGRALLHDKELTYSCVVPVNFIKNGENITKSYEFISTFFIDIFRMLNINLTIGGLERHISNNNYCMSISTGADLCLGNKKFIGSAQYRKNGYILQHGSILLDFNPDLIEKVFREKTDFSNIVSLNQINSALTVSDIIQAAKTYFSTIKQDCFV